MTVFDRDLKDAQADNISLDRRFTTAYNAALMTAKAALAAKGYRTAGEANHFVTIKSLEFTLTPDPVKIAVFNRYRRQRNLLDYEMAGIISGREVAEIIALAEYLRASLTMWLKDNYPELS
jgi:uncharacterized protein (UPF0332 family)